MQEVRYFMAATLLYLEGALYGGGGWLLCDVEIECGPRASYVHTIFQGQVGSHAISDHRTSPSRGFKWSALITVVKRRASIRLHLAKSLFHLLQPISSTRAYHMWIPWAFSSDILLPHRAMLPTVRTVQKRPCTVPYGLGKSRIVQCGPLYCTMHQKFRTAPVHRQYAKIKFLTKRKIEKTFEIFHDEIIIRQ